MVKNGHVFFYAKSTKDFGDEAGIMAIKDNDQKAVKEKNIFKQDGRVYVRSIKKCTCTEKQDDTFTLECRIMERGGT